MSGIALLVPRFRCRELMENLSRSLVGGWVFVQTSSVLSLGLSIGPSCGLVIRARASQSFLDEPALWWLVSFCALVCCVLSHEHGRFTAFQFLCLEKRVEHCGEHQGGLGRV